MTTERYSWTEDALGATRAVQRARAMTASYTTSRGSIVDHVLCFAVGALGLLLLYVALTAPPTTWSGMIAGLVLVSLSVIAALQHWGPIMHLHVRRDDRFLTVDFTDLKFARRSGIQGFRRAADRCCNWSDIRRDLGEYQKNVEH